MLIDSFGRTITYLRISVTDRCNLRCAYCLPEEGVKWMPMQKLLTTDEIIQVAEAAADLGINKIRITGGEPLVRHEIFDITAGLSAIPGIKDLSMTTNATLLAKRAKDLVKAGVRRINISLDTLNAEKFRRVTRFGEFDRVWQGLLAAEAAGMDPIKINTVVVGGFNDDEITALARLSLEHPWHIRFIELMPVAEQQNWGKDWNPFEERYVSVQRMHASLWDLDLQPVTTQINTGPEQTYRIPGAPGTVGFIAPMGDQFCSICNRLRLTADGYLRPCLLVDQEISVREALKSGMDLRNLIKKAVREKPKGHELEKHKAPEKRCMSQIGG